MLMKVGESTQKGETNEKGERGIIEATKEAPERERPARFPRFPLFIIVMHKAKRKENEARDCILIVNLFIILLFF